MKIKTFVFLDLESTGLPFLSTGKIKITEISLVGVSRDSLRFLRHQSKPRVLHKLLIAINPRKLISDEAANITGLCNFQLEEESPLNLDKANLISNFLSSLKKPICLIAHNGAKFDFPLLKEELKNFDGIISEDVRCCDSIPAFKNFHTQERVTDYELFEACDRAEKEHSEPEEEDILMSQTCGRVENIIREGCDLSLTSWRERNAQLQELNEKTPEAQIVRNSFSNKEDCCCGEGSYLGVKRKLFDDGAGSSKSKMPKMSLRLEDIYVQFFGEKIRDAHCAESDAIALMECVLKVGEPIFQFFDQNSTMFKDIKPMYTQ